MAANHIREVKVCCSKKSEFEFLATFEIEFKELSEMHKTCDLELCKIIRPLVLDTVSVSDTFEMYLYWHIDTFFMENVSVYQYILRCRYFF